MAIVLTLIFLVLKLTKTVDWEWKWVFSPIWIDLIAAVVLVVIAFIFSLIIVLAS